MSSTKAHLEGSVVEQRQNPVGPPPTYNEAIHSSPCSATPMPMPMPMPTPTPRAYPTTAPYPIIDNAMPLPLSHGPTAPYPVDVRSGMPSVEPALHGPTVPVYGNHWQPTGPTDGWLSAQQPQPIVEQPFSANSAAYNEQYLHPKTTYVVLREDARAGRGRDSDNCTCVDWCICCWCCVESCRCLLLCLECCK